MLKLFFTKIKELEDGLLSFLSILVILVAASSFVIVTDMRSSENEKNIEKLEIEVEMIKQEVGKIQRIDQRTIIMQEDIRLIKEHLIK